MSYYRTIKWPQKARTVTWGLDGKEAEIQILFAKKVSKASIAKILNVSRSALLYFISSRALC